MAAFLALGVSLPDTAVLSPTERSALIPAAPTQPWGSTAVTGGHRATQRASDAVADVKKAAVSPTSWPMGGAATKPAATVAPKTKAPQKPVHRAAKAAHPKPKRHVTRHVVRHPKRHVVRHATHRTKRHAVHHAKRHVTRHAKRHVVRHVVRHATRHVVRHAVRQQPVRPGYVVQGHYLRHLAGRAGDLTRMYWLGAADANRNPAGQSHLVLLDIGGQSLRGVYLSLVNRFVTYRELTAAVSAYAAGYHEYQRRRAPVTIALGTNNDLYTTAFAGHLWATQVVNPVQRATRRYRNLTIAGADDIEPGFNAGPAHTTAWLYGYLHATRAKFVFNGSADGCSTRRAWSHCNHGWTAHTLSLLAGNAAPSRIIALPQIYNPAMAGQWAQISRTAKLNTSHPLRIVGPLTEQAACGRHPDCPSMSSRRAWQLLHLRLSAAGVHPASLPVQVDLDVR